MDIGFSLNPCPRKLGAVHHGNVSFLTFNFDSVIEDQLSDAMARAYPSAPGEEVKKIVESMVGVTHVHGRLPPIPSGEVAVGTPKRIDPAWVQWTRVAADSVSVVTDRIDRKVLGAAQEAIRSSKVVCFLGFQYYPDNLNRLGVPGTLDTAEAIFGSAYGSRRGCCRRRRRTCESLEPDGSPAGNIVNWHGHRTGPQLLFVDIGVAQPTSLGVLDLDDSSFGTLVGDGARHFDPVVSPNGSWLADESEETGPVKCGCGHSRTSKLSGT